MAGTVGAIFNCALQLGGAVGIAAVSSIETSIEVHLPKNAEGMVSDYKGRAAAFWFLLAVVGVELLNIVVFYKVERGDKNDIESEGEGGQYEKEGIDSDEVKVDVSVADDDKHADSAVPVLEKHDMREEKKEVRLAIEEVV